MQARGGSSGPGHREDELPPGVIQLVNVDMEQFKQGELFFLQSLCDFAAIAIENAVLYERIERQERRLEQDLAAIVESSDDAIISKNLDGIITSWNKSAERIFGYTAEEMVGKSITLLFPPDRLDEERFRAVLAPASVARWIGRQHRGRGIIRLAARSAHAVRGGDRGARAAPDARQDLAH